MYLDFSSSATERTGRVKEAIKLHRSVARKRAGLFLVEGENSLEAALAAEKLVDVFVTESASRRYTALINRMQSSGVHVHPVTDKAGRKLSGTVTAPGIVGTCKNVVTNMCDADFIDCHLVAVGVGLSDPGNVGTLIRIADALGADGVVCAGDTADPQGLKAVRSSAGSLFNLPVRRYSDSPTLVTALHDKGLLCYATTIDSRISITESGDLLAQPTAWLFGNEAHGLPTEMIAEADSTITIPIRGRAESLNVVTAAAICMYESVKIQAGLV